MNIESRSTSLDHCRRNLSLLSLSRSPTHPPRAFRNFLLRFLSHSPLVTLVVRCRDECSVCRGVLTSRLFPPSSKGEEGRRGSPRQPRLARTPASTRSRQCTSQPWLGEESSGQLMTMTCARGAGARVSTLHLATSFCPLQHVEARCRGGPPSFQADRGFASDVARSRAASIT